MQFTYLDRIICADNETAVLADPEKMCSQIFYICLPELIEALQMKCPEPLHYCVDSQQCLEKKDIPGCGGKLQKSNETSEMKKFVK